MGLFGKKNNKTISAAEEKKPKAAEAVGSSVSADEIWSRPVRNTADRVRTDVKIKENITSTPSVFNGPKGISQKMLEEKMAELEKEIEEREKQAPEHYILDEITPSAMNRANAEFEKTVEEITFRRDNTTYGNILPASVDGIEEKVKKLDEQYGDIVNKASAEIDIQGISKEDYEKQLDEYQEKISQKRHEIIRKMPGLTETQKEAIRKFFELDIVAKPLEYVNSIPELSQKDLDRIRKQLEEIYALENAAPTINEPESAENK